MTQFEKLKSEINAMDVEAFIKHFITRKGGAKDFICGNIKHPQAHCTKTDDYNCLECLREYLRGEVNE